MALSDAEQSSMSSNIGSDSAMDEKKEQHGIQPVEPASSNQTTSNPSNEIDPSNSEKTAPIPSAPNNLPQQPFTTTLANEDTIEPPASHSSAVTTTTSATPPLPSLEYTLRTRKLYITIFWSLILFDSIAIPIVLYFTLDRLTSLSNNAVFSISTGALGGISILEYLLRLWRLWRKDSTCRVVGARTRWYFDWFHWNFSAAWFFPIAELIIGTCFPNPPIRLLAMPVSSLCFWFGIELLIEDTMRVRGYPAPCRISSMPKGAPMRPGIYSLIEDVVAVDGSGGTDFRRRLDARYLASPRFRTMVSRLSWFWGAGSLGIAIATTAMVFTISRDAAYVIGWTVPFVWAGIWTIMTFTYVLRSLRIEKETWGVVKA